MKNKVDFGKLIEKKYKGKTLDLNDILDEIDLVIQESDQSWLASKVIPSNLEENPQSKQVYDRMHGAPGVRNTRPPEPGYQDNVDVLPQVRPTTVAEASPSSKGVQEPIAVSVPDLFSIITNSELVIKDDDRQIINDIVASFNSSGQHWTDKINSMQQFITENASTTTGFNGDLRQAISKLIYLNLIKKISYFTAQPGKLFEYIIAPIIGPESKVVGKDDKDIIDVDSANENGYSIKLFTGDVSFYVVQGSYEGLFMATKQMPVQYIIAVVDKNSKTISFAELSVSPRKEHFLNKGWKLISKLQQGSILSKEENSITKYGIYVDLSGKDSKYFTSDEINILGEKIKTNEIQSRIDEIIQFQQITDPVERLRILLQIIKKYSQIEKDVRKKIADLKFKSKNLTPQNLIDLNQKVPEYFDELISIILKELREKAQEQNALKEATEGDYEASGDGKFKIPIRGSWKSLSSISLELGDPKVYNQFQLNIASDIQKTMINVLNGFSSLGKNITLYFGTTTHKQMTRREEMTTYAQDCVNDANKIVSGIKEIATSEGENIK